MSQMLQPNSSTTDVTVAEVPKDKTPKQTTTHKESFITKLYQSLVHVERCEPIIQMDDLTITAKELQSAMAKYMPYERSVQRKFKVTDDPQVSVDTYTKIIKCLLKLEAVAGDESTRIIECVQVEKFKKVKFIHTDVGPTGKILPARFVLQIPVCKPNSVQCINTGYVLNVPKDVRQRSIVDGTITIAPEESEQSVNFVLIPQILSRNKHMIPQCVPRDPFDTGLFTINILNVTGETAEVSVFLYAYLVRTVLQGNDYSIRRQSQNKLFKAKDSTVGNGRFIKNLDIGVYYEKGVIEDMTMKFNMFDNKSDACPPINNDALVIHNVPTLISSRKREWFNDQLFTISGMFLPQGTSCMPIVAEGSVYNDNCFCITSLDARLELHTITGTVKPEFKMINGAMFDLTSYKVLRKIRNVMIKSIITLKGAALACRMFDKEKFDYFELLRLADFGQVLSLDKLKEIETLYENRHNDDLLQKLSTDKQTHSQKLYNYFKQLATVFCKPRITCDKRSFHKAFNDYTESVDNKNKI